LHFSSADLFSLAAVIEGRDERSNLFGYHLPKYAAKQAEHALKLILTISFLFVSLNVHAGGVYRHSGDTLQKLYAELHYLNQVGHEIHDKYDIKEGDVVQLSACKSEYGYIATRAKATIGIANRLDSPNKEEYIATGWKAYECIKCTGDVKSCDAIPPTLETIKQEFKQQRAQQN
jgi:hypothetical protein